jgi:hypothetical protein
MTTKSEAMAADDAALMRARNPLLWVTTSEEARVERYLVEAAAAASFVPLTWDVAQGVCDLAGKPVSALGNMQDPGTLISAIDSRARAPSPPPRGAFIMRDLPPWLTGPQNAITVRALRNLARLLPGVPTPNAQCVIVLSPSGEIPPELAGHVTVLDWPRPDRTEIGEILDAALEPYDDKQVEKPSNGQREACIGAAVGLSGEEAQATFARSIVQLRKVDPLLVSGEKKRVIAREKILEWFDPLAGGLDSVGGLDNLKAWLRARSDAYSPQAKAYGLPAPRGSLLVGVPGCGKSLTAKAVSTAWGIPLLRLDLGALKSRFVGGSEANLRRAFAVIEAIGRCVVWLDEIEKSLQGATSGSSDGGVSADALGQILSWMQERSGEAFVIATANEVESLPPELLRKGRFDEIFFVDLPNVRERTEVLHAALRAHKRKHFDCAEVAYATEGFTGAELAALVPDALFVGFADKRREIKAADLLNAAKAVVPLSKTAPEKIKRIREWGAARARPATGALIEEAAPLRARGRKVEL